MGKLENRISFRTFSPKHKEILAEAAEDHHTGRLSSFMRAWSVPVVRLVQSGISPELLIANIDTLIQFCKSLKQYKK